MTVPVVRRFPEQFGSYPRNLPLVDCTSQLIQLGGIIKMTSTFTDTYVQHWFSLSAL